MPLHKKIEYDETSLLVNELSDLATNTVLATRNPYSKSKLSDEEYVKKQNILLSLMEERNLQGYNILKEPGFIGDCWSYIATKIQILPSRQKLAHFITNFQDFDAHLEEPSDECIVMHLNQKFIGPNQYPHVGIYQQVGDVMSYSSKWSNYGPVVEHWDFKDIEGYRRILPSFRGPYVMFFRFPTVENLSKINIKEKNKFP